jgi:hypothetical protein
VLYAGDPALEYLGKLEEPGRVIALCLSSPGCGGGDPIFTGDALMLHGVRAVTGHQGNELQRWVELAGVKSPAPPPNLVRREFRRITNARFWLTDVELPAEHPQLPGMRFIRRVGPVRNAAGSEVWLFELDESSPAAWVTPLIAEAGADAIRTTVMDPSFDVRRAALFDSSNAVEGASVRAAPQLLAISTRVQYLAPREIRIDLGSSAPARSALVVSENWYPGWSARVDGKTVPVGRADYTLIGVPLTEGARRIELSFTDTVYERGRIITIVALLLAGALVVGGLVVERRRRA